jgi:hypothetical protein
VRIACMEEPRNSHPLGRTSPRWADNIIIDHREICVVVDLKGFYEHDNVHLRVTRTARNVL